jgi:cobalt-zinc-cadmium efflux system protein
MLGVSVYIAVEADRSHRRRTAEVSSGPMLIVGAIGLVVNLSSRCSCCEVGPVTA